MRSLKALFAAVFISVAIIFIGNYNVLADEEPVFEKPTLIEFFEIKDTKCMYDGGYYNIDIIQPENLPVIVTEPVAISYVESAYGTSVLSPEITDDIVVVPVISYSLTGNNDYSTEFIGVKNSGEHTVYFKITADGYEDYTGSAKVIITARPFSIAVSDQTIKYGEQISSDSSYYTLAPADILLPEEPISDYDPIDYIFAEGETAAIELKVDGDSSIIPEIKISDSSDTPVDVTNNYDISVTPGTLTYTLVTPTLSNISATSITYGEALGDSTISGDVTYGTDTVSGTFAFANPNTAPAVADSGSEYDFTFTPADSVAKYFNPVSGKVSVTVNPVSLSGATVTLNTTELTYTGSEQSVTVSSVILGEAELTSGDYEVSGNTGTVPGSYTVTVTGKGNYSGSATAAFSIERATPTLSDIEATSITWGQALGESTISGVAKFGNEEVSGTWSFDAPDTIPANAGTFRFNVTFTPDDSVAAFYTSASGKASIKVNPVSINDAVVTLNSNILTYTGSVQTVSVEKVELNGVELSSDCYQVFGNTGTDVRPYIVTVTGMVNYSGSATATFIITPAIPELSDISTTAITLGDALSASTITGVAKFNNEVISGIWSFKNPDTIPANAGTENYDVIFTPADDISKNYTAASGKVSVKVKPISIKGAKVTLSTNSLTYTGSELTVSVESVKLGDVVLSPEYYSVSGNTGTDPGSYIVTVKGKGNYTGSAIAAFRIFMEKVEPITPTLSDIVAADITLGESLNDSLISGQASVDGVKVPGTFRFDNPSFVPENFGTSTYDVTFTPDNSVADLYTSALGKVSVTVNPVSINGATVTLIQIELTYTGSAQTISVASVTLGDVVLPTNCYEVSGNTGTDVGEYTVTVTGKGNSSGSATATFEIKPATPTLSDINATDITWGDALKESTITGKAEANGVEISGTWGFNDPELVPQNTGTSTYDVTFTPADDISKNFTSGSGKVYVTVNPVSISGATVTLSKNELTYTGSAQTVSVTSVTLGDAVLLTDDYEVSGNTGTAAGNYTVTVKGKGNYAGTATATFEIINPAPEPGSESHGPITPVLSNISATSITWGDALNKSTITGVAEADGAEVSGTWSFTNPDTKPENIGTYSYEARFTPSDTTNYSSVTTNVSVTVNRGIRTVPGSLSAEFVYSTSVSLTSFTDCEYSMNGTDWQDSYTFTGLNPDTEYTFYARYKASPNYTITDESAYTSIKVKTATHTHEWTFTASGNTITATCANRDGGHEGELTQKIVIKASNYNYNGKELTARVIGSIDGITISEITYKKGNKVLSNAPVDAGTYTANISIFDDVNNQTITASKEFKIRKAKYKIKRITKTITVKASDLNKKSITKSLTNNFTVLTVNNTKVKSNKIKFINASSSSIKSKFKINSRNGKITIKKGTKKGSFTIKVKVAVSSDTNHETAKETFYIKVTVK